MRESSPPGRGLGDRPERQARRSAGSGTRPRRHPSRPDRAPSARPGTRRRRARSHAAPPRPPRRTALPPLCRRRAQLGCGSASTSASARCSSASAACDGVVALVERRQLATRLCAALEQLGVRLHAVAAAQVGQLLELRLDLLEPSRLRLERREERLAGRTRSRAAAAPPVAAHRLRRPARARAARAVRRPARQRRRGRSHRRRPRARARRRRSRRPRRAR